MTVQVNQRFRVQAVVVQRANGRYGNDRSG